MTLNNQEIKKIYDDFVLPKKNNHYYNRYEKLPIEFNNRIWKWENKDLPRVISLLEFKKFIEENNLFFNDVLSLNGSGDPEFEYLSYKNVFNYNYLDNPEKHNLLNIDLDKKDFDFFMSNQTLEHIYDPCLVLKNINKHLKIGGYLYINVPAFNMAHDTPYHHFVGFTPTGLGCITKQAGFEILDIGFWGNTQYINYMMNNNDWPDFRKFNNYISEDNKEVITWIFAKKEINLF